MPECKHAQKLKKPDPHPPKLFCQSAASKLLGITPFGTFPHHVYKALHSTRGITCLYTWLDCSAWSVQKVKTVHLQCDSSYIYIYIFLYHVLSKFYLHFWIDSFCLENQRIDLIQSKSTTARSWISSAGETAMSSNPWESHNMIVMKRKTQKKCILSKLQEFTLLYCPYSLNVPDLTCHKMQTSIVNCLKQRARQGSSEVCAKQCMNLQHGLHFWLATFWDQRTCAFVPPLSLKRNQQKLSPLLPELMMSTVLHTCRCGQSQQRQSWNSAVILAPPHSNRCQIAIHWKGAPICPHEVARNRRIVIHLHEFTHGIGWALCQTYQLSGSCFTSTPCASDLTMPLMPLVPTHRSTWSSMGTKPSFPSVPKRPSSPKRLATPHTHTHRILTNTQNHYNFRNLFDPGPGNPV